MARKPRPSEIAAKAAKKAAKKSTSKKSPRPGTKAGPSKDEIKGGSLAPETMRLPPKGFIKKLVTVTLKKFEDEAASARGDMGGTIATACEKNHVEKRALAIARRLHKLPPKKLQETYFHLMDYMEELRIRQRAEEQGQLSLDQQQDDGGDAETSGETGETGGEEPLPGTDGKRSPQLKIVDAPQSTADAMAEAIEKDTTKVA